MSLIFSLIIAFIVVFWGLYYLGSGLEKEFEKDKNRLVNDIADEVVARLKKEKDDVAKN